MIVTLSNDFQYFSTYLFLTKKGHYCSHVSDVIVTNWACTLHLQSFRLLQQSYVDAIVINYMRNRIVEELKVEGLTTRRGHHRKPEHRGPDSIEETNWLVFLCYGMKNQLSFGLRFPQLRKMSKNW